ncbi:uncharacterized protein SOCEGT47_043290 [Sorangium cellulosum]|jgi:hypothetical protein|uniref:Secreted protein n=1 Tax=Sorangium cellulosum TaxID=56 RepID=A0A4P2Q3D9_SORCE|nr:DUF6184 family natural product biosynthesis lipoprotein [Sorangium cellulosum]AUX23799.1 uncharacterized protein SOCEGT47_043290 [Sorangium cellulosum]
MRTIVGRPVVGPILMAGVSLLSAACGGGEGAGARAPDSIEGEAPVPVGSAVDSIVAARCDREARCNNIGADREYANRDACDSSVRSEWRDELTFGECPGGIDAKELNECLEAIRDEECGSPLDTLGRLAACRASDLCREGR